MSVQNIGYIRVSSVGQNTERQLADVALDRVFEDFTSGKNTDRPQLKECMNHLRIGDELHVHSIDRLARNLKDLQAIVDELKDKGAEIWYQTVVEVKKLSPLTTIETLIPDVQNKWEALYRMIDAGQEVVSHNMETVKRLYRRVRPQAKYERSLEQIRLTKAYGKRTKSGIMLGLGETQEDVFEAMDELANNGLDILTLGQYLQPTKMHHEVIEFIPPDTFAMYREEGLKRGLKYVESGPLVRSSYHSERHVNV